MVRICCAAAVQPAQLFFACVTHGPGLTLFRGYTSSGLRSARVAMRKRFGQHLLTNADTVKKIVDGAQLTTHETVFEIGPGTGNLTVHLLAAAHTVYAVELDDRLSDILLPRVEKAAAIEERLNPAPAFGRPALLDRLRLAQGDFLRVPLPAFDALVANIPYQISSPVLRRLLAHSPAPSRAIIMFQKEFAERMVAKPGSKDYCRLSVNTTLLCDARIVMRIGREQFRPPPKVDSAVIRLVPHPPPENLDFAQWDAMLKLLFSSKNKTLRACLGGSKHVLGRLTRLRVGEAVRGGEGGTGGADMIETSDGRFPRATLALTRTCVIAACRTALQWSAIEPNSGDGARANGLSLPQFQALYSELVRQGFRFVVPRDGEQEVEEREGEGDDESVLPLPLPLASGVYGSLPRLDTAPSSAWSTPAAGSEVVHALYRTAREHCAARQNAVRQSGPTATGTGAGRAVSRDARTSLPVLLYPPPPTPSPTLLQADEWEDGEAEARLVRAATDKARTLGGAARRSKVGKARVVG